MQRKASLTFIGSNNLIHSAKNAEDSRKLWHQFGFLGEDYRQIMVNEDIKNAIPKPEDFLPFTFRHISSTIVGAHTWKATEFTDKVLKKGVKLIENKPSYVNHELETSNVIGGIGKAKFTPSFTASDGTKVPGGIDAPIWVDAMLHPDLCRKLAAFPVPHIQSVSVTISYEWEPSHVFEDREGNEDEWMFESRIGSMVDGEMVRRVVTKIIDIYESSLVWNGADPFAKILDENGDPLNIDKSSIVGMSKFDKDPLSGVYKNKNLYFIQESCFNASNRLDLQVKIFGKQQNEENFKNHNKNNDMELAQYIAQVIGCKEEEVTPDKLKEFAIVPKTDHDANTEIVGLVGSKDNFTKIKSERDDLKTKFDTVKQEKDQLQTQVEGNKPLVDHAEGTLASLKKLAMKHYRLKAGKDETEEFSDSVTKMIDRAEQEKDFETLQTLAKQYAGEAYEQFTPECKSCGSKEISLRSSEETDEGGKGESEEMPDLVERFRY